MANLAEAGQRAISDIVSALSATSLANYLPGREQNS
jgi:hypothetical protein